MLLRGIESVKGRHVSRAEFSVIAEISPKTVYAYFASTEARDYRRLSDDSRIAMIWRVTSREPALSSTALQLKIQTGDDKRVTCFVVDGVLLSIKDAAKKLGYTPGSLSRKINNLAPGTDISHMENEGRGKKPSRYFIVDGETLSMKDAAKKLGYVHPGSLYLKTSNLASGTDISHMKNADRGKK